MCNCVVMLFRSDVNHLLVAYIVMAGWLVLSGILQLYIYRDLAPRILHNLGILIACVTVLISAIALEQQLHALVSTLLFGVAVSVLAGWIVSPAGLRFLFLPVALVVGWERLGVKSSPTAEDYRVWDKRGMWLTLILLTTFLAMALFVAVVGYLVV